MDVVKKQMVFKALKIGAFALRKASKFSLIVLADSLEASTKSKEYEPTLNERMYGEKLPITGRYFIPDEKHLK